MVTNETRPLRVVLVCGAPGSGESTIANDLSGSTGATVLSSEAVRAELFDLAAEPSDRYFSPNEVERTYACMIDKARSSLLEGESIILDGFYRSEDRRRPVQDLADEHSVTFFGFCVYCDFDVAMRRVAERKKRGTLSPTGPANLQKVRNAFEWPNGNYIRIDNTQDRLF
ncbi:AAA family ATPase [uncultured Roseobacter sp.]|uniref:AAA family ATPase n=1 Tax=uncultured Roseobacter sp. TaxID=114847 RepID=UPI00342A994D